MHVNKVDLDAQVPETGAGGVAEGLPKGEFQKVPCGRASGGACVKPPS